MPSERIETWRVLSYPPRCTHPTLEGAVAAAGMHPLQPWAKVASAELAGRVLTAASWSDTEVRIAFDGGRCLQVFVADHFVGWRVEHAGAAALEPGAFAADVDLEWEELGLDRWHRREELQRRIGASCQRLFVNDFGLLLYCERLPILCFMAVRDIDHDRDVLYYSDLD